MNQMLFGQAAQLNNQQSQKWFTPVCNAMAEFAIVRPIDQAMFIAQIAYESAGFSRLAESFNYSVAALERFVNAGHLTRAQATILGRQPNERKLPIARQQEIANLVYAGRFGNSNQDDGWRYRGRGLIQITFKDNYFDCGNALTIDLVANPDLLTQPQEAARSAAWFYTAHGCLLYSGDIVQITRIINGGNAGLEERHHHFLRVLKMLA